MNRPTRRQFLAAAAAATSVGLAGCVAVAKTCNGSRPTPATVVEPAAEPTPGSPPGGANWPMVGRDPGNTWYTPDLSAGGLVHRFTVSLPVEGGEAGAGEASPTPGSPNRSPTTDRSPGPSPTTGNSPNTPTGANGTATGATRTAGTATAGTATTGTPTTGTDESEPTRTLWPVAVDDRVYVADAGGSVRALRAADGSEVWASREATPAHPLAVGEQRVYAATGEAVVALDRGDGTVRWRYADGTNFSAPVLAGGAVYLAGGARLHAIDARDGARRWVAERLSRPARPAVDDRAVYVASDNGRSVRAFDPADGTDLWEKTGEFGRPASAESDLYDGTRPPAVRDGRVYLPQAGAVVALDAGTGETAWTWTSHVNDYEGTVAATPDLLFFKAHFQRSRGDDTMFARGTGEGEKHWCREVDYADLSTAPVAGPEGALAQFGFDDDTDRIVAFDADDGSIPWAFAGYEGRAVSPVVAGGSLYVGTDKGMLYALTLT